MEVQLLPGSEIDKAEWDAFVEQSPQGAPYQLTGYMERVAPGYQVITVRKGGHLKAVMPFQTKTKAIWTSALQPGLSQYWGVLFAPDTFSSAYKEFREKRKWVSAIVERLPSEIDWLGYSFAPTFDYPLPFHWAGYTLQTRYTYQLSLEPSEAQLREALDPKIRQNIRKYAEEGGEIHTASTVAPLLSLIRENAARGRQLLSAEATQTLEKLADWLIETGHGEVLTYRTADQSTVAAVLLIHFAGKTIYLMGALHPEHKSSGIMPVLMWQAILEARSRSQLFDFEGSMIEGIEKFFRGFSPRPVPYLYIHKNKLPLLLKWFKKLQR